MSSHFRVCNFTKREAIPEFEYTSSESCCKCKLTNSWALRFLRDFWSEVAHTCAGLCDCFEIMNCSGHYLFSAWNLIDSVALELDCPYCPFFDFHVHGWPMHVAWLARELDIKWTFLNSWLDSITPFVHAVLELDSCNRGIGFVTYLKPDSCSWSFLLLHALILLLHAWILWLHEAWLMIFDCFSLCRCPLARFELHAIVSTFNSARSSCCCCMVTKPELVFAISPKR